MPHFRTRAGALLAVLVVASALASAAQAKEGPETQANFYRATTHATRSMPAASRVITLPVAPSTFPEGSPDYHGANGG